MFKKFNQFVNEAKLAPYKVPMTIGFRKRPDFKHGLVKEFFKFFYMVGDQPEGNFKTMADYVHDRGYDLDKELQDIGDIAQEIHDYLRPPSGKDPAYDLNSLHDKGAGEAIVKYFDQANQLAKVVEDGASRGGAAKKSKIAQGLKGVLASLTRAKNIFTSNFGAVKHKPVGFKFANEASGIFVPGAKGAISTNTADQETKLKPEDEDEEDPYNPSIINKFAAKRAGDNTVFVSKNKKTPGSGISTGRRVSEGGFGDNQVAGQPVFTQHVDKSKQGYQDAVNYDDDVEDHGEDCDCPECQFGTNGLVSRK